MAVVSVTACLLIYSWMRRRRVGSQRSGSEHIESKRDGSGAGIGGGEGSGPVASASPESQNTKTGGSAPAPPSGPLLPFDAQSAVSEHGTSRSTAAEQRMEDQGKTPGHGVEDQSTSPEGG